MTEHRTQTLETKLAYLEHTLDELNDVVYKQSLQLEKLEAHNNQLTNRLQQALSLSSNSEQEHEVPPHY